MEPIQFFLSACLMLALYWAAGSMLLPLLAEVQKLSSSVRFFLQLVLGFFGTTILVALYYTSGYTVMALTLPAFGVILWLRRQEIRRISVKDFGMEWRHGAEVLAALALLVLVQLYRNDYFNAEIVSAGAYDFGIYTTVAEYLKISGIETSSPWYQLFEESADGLAKPYHYGDLWSLALLFDLSPAVPIDNYIYVWIPLINAVLFSGFAAVFRMVSGRQGWLGPVVAFMALFLNMRIEAWDWSWAFGWNAVVAPKISTFPLGLTAGLIVRHHSIRHIEILILVLMMIFDIILASVIMITFSLYYIIYAALFKAKNELAPSVVTGITALAIWLFYQAIGAWLISSIGVVDTEQSYYYRLIKFFLASQIKYYLFFMPVMIAVIWTYRLYRHNRKVSEAMILPFMLLFQDRQCML